MKVLIINKHLLDTLGGSEMQCDLIAKGLHARGHEVVYGAIKIKNKSIKDYNEVPYRVVSLAPGKYGYRSLLTKEQPDIIYWRHNKHNLQEFISESKKQKIPFVFAIAHVNDTLKLPPLRHLINATAGKAFYKYPIVILKNLHYFAWNHRAFKNVDAVTSVNSEYIGSLPVANQRTIWNAVEIKTEEFNWPRPFCLWVANIKPRKRPEIFIELSRMMGKRALNMDFIMVGAIQDHRYHQLINEAKKLNNFHYFGFKNPEKVNGILRKAVCLVHTCMPEGFSNNFIQAWMNQCPTITYEFDPEKLIAGEQMGFVTGTIDEMAKKVETLAKDKSLRDEIGIRAYQFARKNFGIDRMIDEVEDLLISVINDRTAKS